MPVTPFHFGPGLLLKGTAPARVSLLSFLAAQVALDLESGYRLLRRDWPFHRGLHTLLLAAPVGLGVGFLVWAAGRRLPWLRARLGPELGLAPALVAGLLGTLSHVALDAVVHDDVRPLAPWSPANPFLQLLSSPSLEALCVACGLLGAALWAWREPGLSRPAEPKEEV